MKLVFSDTLSSAFLAQIVRSFEMHHPNHFLGRTAMQKLTYFCKAISVPIPCSFEIYNYGPYSDEVTFAVDAMMADEVICDASKRKGKYSNYRLNNQAARFSPVLQEEVDRFSGKIDSVVAALGDFEPSTLELIATLHFVADRKKNIAGKKPSKEVVIRGFQDIKGSKFAENDIEEWYVRLKRANLV